MIGYLEGTLLAQTENCFLVGLGQPGHGMVGYQVFVPGGARYQMYQLDEGIQLFIAPRIREDAFDLYGFQTAEEKELFHILVGVNGVGPKAALAILAESGPAEVIQAIWAKDTRFFSRISGIGKKTAERIIVEATDPLQTQLKKSQQGKRVSSARGQGASAYPEQEANAPATGATHASGGGMNEEKKISDGTDASKKSSPQQGKIPDPQIYREVVEALRELGYRDEDVLPWVREVVGEFSESSAQSEDLIRETLKRLA